MNMRQQMVKTLEELMAYDERLVVVLAEISYSLFNKNNTAFAKRILNVGIMEQTMVSVAAGIAMEGFIPVVHSIMPFLVERPLSLHFLVEAPQAANNSYNESGWMPDWNCA
jgi:transketolase